MSAIAARHGISIQKIANTNNIRNINNIRIGQVLVIPASGNGGQSPISVVPTDQPTGQPTSPDPAQVSTNQVVTNQVVTNQVESVPVQSDQAAVANPHPNNSHSEPTSPPLPAPTSAMQQHAGCHSSPGANEGIHSVRPGDTLYGISRTYGATVTAVRQRNGLSSDRIRVGECLIVPAGATVTPVPDRRRSSEQPPVTNTPTSSPTPVTPIYTAQSQG